MKNFFTSLLGALVALVVFFGGCLVLGFLFLAVLVAVGQKRPAAVENGSYLVFDLSTRIQDAPVDFDGGALFGPLLGGSRITTLQLRTVTRAIRSAARDPRIAGLLITSQKLPVDNGVGFGSLKELRAAIEEFKRTGKPVMAYLNAATTRDYYVASAASDLVLDPYGMLLLPGLASQPLFMAGAFEKFGVGVQVTRVGKYKSAVEPFTRKDLSPEAREDLQKLLDDLWADLLADVAHSRGLKRAELQRAVDAHGLFMASDALAARLVDRTAYRDEVIDELKQRTGRRKDSTEPFKQINLRTYAGIVADNAPLGDGRGRVAVVYAEGDIVDGEGQSGEVGGRKFSRELRRLRLNPDIKAIVLRVNSPGGSAMASEEIQRELRLTLQTKPVVVSMGSVAASGGYWISTYADRIFAEPTTITGSIGVFGLFINVQQLANNLGFTWDTVKTGRLAGLLTISRPKTDEELAVFQRMVDWIYDQFTDKVAAARKLDKAKVLEIAQGRVWSGVEAKKIGLVDEIGGLNDAVAYVAKKAGLGTRYRVVEFPRKRELKDIINDVMQDVAPGDAFGNGALKQMLGEFKAQIEVLSHFNDPHGVYARLPVDVRIQ
jgi:protease-4